MLVILALVAGTPAVGSTLGDADPATLTATVAVPAIPLQAPWVRDEAAMILVGSALLGLAAALRRAV